MHSVSLTAEVLQYKAMRYIYNLVSQFRPDKAIEAKDKRCSNTTQTLGIQFTNNAQC